MRETRKITYAGMFLAISVLLPYIFHVTGVAGPVFLPMHIPVLLCGFICGRKYGFIVGALAPLINTAVSGMPVLYPIGVSMVFELAAYGFFAGLLYDKFKNVFVGLIGSMLIGRIVSGAVKFLIIVPFGGSFVFKGFLTATFVTALWGIVIQLILIPAVIKIYEKLS